MIRRPARRFRHHTFETKLTKIKGVDKSVDDPDRIVLVDIIIQRCWEQCTLCTIFAFDKTLHRQSPNSN